MDHILQVRAEHQSNPKRCDRGAAGFTRSAGDASLVTLALAAIAFLALFLSPLAGSPSSSSSSTLSARLVAVVGGSIFASKTALFLLSNVIFVVLVADYYRCCFAAATASTGHGAASSGEPGGAMEKRAQHHQVQVQVEQCAVQSCAPCSESLDDHSEQEGEDSSTMASATATNTVPDEGQLSELELELELVRLGEEEEEGNSIPLELEETVDVDEPTCEAAQGPLDRLEISELNKKFDEFIRSRRVKWVKEEASLLLSEVPRSEFFQIDAIHPGN